MKTPKEIESEMLRQIPGPGGLTNTCAEAEKIFDVPCCRCKKPVGKFYFAIAGSTSAICQACSVDDQGKFFTIRKTSNLDFGIALDALRTGHRIARSGWNGKGMWLALTPGCTLPAEQFWSPQNQCFAQQNGGTADVLPYITMKTADNKIVPWLASQTDILAEDWSVLLV